MSESQATTPQEEIPEGLLENLELTPDGVEDYPIAARTILPEIALRLYRANVMLGTALASTNEVDLLASYVKKLGDSPNEVAQAVSNIPEVDSGRLVRVVVAGQTVTSHDLGLTGVVDRDLLEMLPELYEIGEFRAKDVLNLGFHSRGSEGARRTAFSYARERVFDKLEFFLGRPVAEKVGDRSTTVYRFLLDVKRHPEDSRPNYPQITREVKKPQKAVVRPRRSPAQKGPFMDRSPKINGFNTQSAERINEEEIPKDIDQLRERVRPAVESLIKLRETETSVKRSKYDPNPSGSNKTVEILRMHWGVTSGGEVSDSMSLEDISRAYDHERAALSNTPLRL